MTEQAGMDLGADNHQWHYWRQIVHERVVEDPEYLQRSMQNIVDRADLDISDRGHTRVGGGLSGRHIEIVVLTRCERPE